MKIAYLLWLQRTIMASFSVILVWISPSLQTGDVNMWLYKSKINTSLSLWGEKLGRGSPFVNEWNVEVFLNKSGILPSTEQNAIKTFKESPHLSENMQCGQTSFLWWSCIDDLGQVHRLSWDGNIDVYINLISLSPHLLSSRRYLFLGCSCIFQQGIAKPQTAHIK